MIALIALASAAQLALQLDASEVVAGQTVGLTLQLVDGRIRGGPPTIEAPSGLVVEFVQQSTQAMMINFETTHTQTFRYNVRALSAGDYTLGPVSVVTNEGPVASAPARLHVVPQGVSDGMEESIADLGDGLAWVGEVLVYHLRYQTAKQLVSARWGPPENALLMVEPGVEPVTADYALAEGGRTIKVQELWYPYRAKSAGKATVAGGSMLVQFAVKRRRGRNDPFFNDLTGFADLQNDSSLSNVLPLEVRALPVEGRPDSFSGLVGAFTFSATSSAASVKVGDTVTVEVVLAGTGSLSGFRLQNWEGDGFRVYDDEPVSETRLVDGKLAASAVFKRAIVAQRPGPLVLPTLRAAWFDPDAGTYVEQELPPIALDVTGDEVKAALQGGGQGAPGGVAVAADDILPVRTDVTIRPPWRGMWAWLLCVPGALLLGLQGLPRLRRRANPSSERPYGFGDLPADADGRLAGLERIFREEAARRLGRAEPLLKREDVASLGEEAGLLYDELDRARYRGGADLPEACVRAWVEAR